MSRNVPTESAPPPTLRGTGPSKAAVLAEQASDAATVRAYSNHPDVIALRVEKVRTQVDVLVWLGITLGLAFTMANVQTFAATGAGAWSLAWIVAWLLDPMVSLVLVAMLRAEQITARYQVGTGVWVNRTKWFCFAATYVMNTWQSWVALSLSGIVLHSVPPVLVFLASQAAPALRDRLTEAVNRAAPSTPLSAVADLPPEPEAKQPELVVTGWLPDYEARAVGAVDRGVVAESECEKTVPLPAIPPAPAAPSVTASKPKRAVSSRPRKKASKPKRAPTRPIEELRTELHQAVVNGRIASPPSAEQIAKELGCGPAKARTLRDEYSDRLTVAA